jgi:hypothetical protein
MKLIRPLEVNVYLRSSRFTGQKLSFDGTVNFLS